MKDETSIRVISASGFKPSLAIESNLSAWVHSGVSLFAERCLQNPDSIFSEMRQQSRVCERLGLKPRNWWEISLHLSKNINRLQLDPALLSFARQEKLSLIELFILAFCGELEQSHYLSLACAELQGPKGDYRPSLHLLGSLVGDLFSYQLKLHEFQQHTFVQNKLINFSGDGPLAMQHVSMAPNVWAVLSGCTKQWHGLKPLAEGDTELIPQDLRVQLYSINKLIVSGQCRALILRGNQPLGELLAFELAAMLGRSAVKIADTAWQSDELFHVLAPHASWLPLVNISMAPGEAFRPKQPISVPTLFICGHEGSLEIEQAIELDLAISSVYERKTIWQKYLPELVESEGESLDNARLDGVRIKSIANTAKLNAQRDNQEVSIQHVIQARKGLAGSTIRQLTQAVDRQVDEASLILPDKVKKSFQQLIQRCKQRENLWRGLGSAAQSTANFGVRALFSGESGTGKTLAASYLATTLATPLYRLDLASVMNKYVGETEKNLALLLDEAVASDSILLFDEADALFGKRGEGESPGERFANMLTNFLLTRIENHQGIVILTSNNRSRIDPAFTRRLDAIIDFPNPNVQERLLIWMNHLGSRAPDQEFCQLLASYCELPGGFIRNAVLNAAALNPSNIDVLSEVSLLDAIEEEYKKLGRTIPVAINQLRANYG